MEIDRNALVISAFESMARLLECAEDRQVAMIHIANKIHELDIPETSNGNGIFIDLKHISMEQLKGITDFLKICVNYHQQHQKTPHQRVKTDIDSGSPQTTEVVITKKKKEKINILPRGNRKEKPVMSDTAASLLKASLKSVRAKR